MDSGVMVVTVFFEAMTKLLLPNLFLYWKKYDEEVATTLISYHLL
jgi:hypothetical protein